MDNFRVWHTRPVVYLAGKFQIAVHVNQFGSKIGL